MTRRPPTLHPDDLKLWARVTATVRPRPGMASPEPPRPKSTKPPERLEPMAALLLPAEHVRPRRPAQQRAPEDIEPNRRRRIGREHLEARIDLHGFDQDRAQAALEGFVLRAADEGYRACLVITGKGSRGEGVLRRRVPEWLAAPALRPVVAGVSEAARHHGGAGALYVALKRKG